MQGFWRRQKHACWVWGWLVAWLLGPEAGAIVLAPDSTFSASVITSVGRQLDSDYPEPSFSVEPWIAYRPSPLAVLRFRSLLDRPLKPHDPMRVPAIELLGIHFLHKQSNWEWGPFLQVGGQDVDRWSADGFQLRYTAGAYLRLFSSRGWSLEAAAGPYLSHTQFSAARSGQPYSQAGMLEQLTAAYQWGPVRFELLALAVQDWQGRWRNLFSTFERLTVRVHSRVSVGLSHQLLRSRVDDTTGALQPIGFFDSRKSRIAGFIQWRL